MSPPLRVVDSGSKTARWNVAMTAALADLRRENRIGDTVRFHSYPKSVLVGRHQVLADAVHVDRCKAAKIEIARRFTGGGAVYMAPGALAWDVVMARNALGTRLDRSASIICEAIASGLSRLGLSARFRPPNDIEVGGRKICGSSGYFDGGTLVYQGTILVDAKLGDIARFLRLPSSRSYRQLRQLSDRVTTVSGLLGRGPDAREIEDALAAAMAHAFGRNLRWDEPRSEELQLAARRHDTEFGTDEYVDGLDTVRGGTAVGRDGPVDAFLRLHPGADRRIEQAWLTGNFVVSPARAIPDLECALRGMPLHAAPAAAISLLSDDRIEMQGVSRHDFVAAIANAAKSHAPPHAGEL